MPFLWIFVPNPPTFEADLIIIQSQGRPPVEHLHKIVFETHKTLPRIFLHYSHIFLKLGNGKPQTKLDIV